MTDKPELLRIFQKPTDKLIYHQDLAFTIGWMLHNRCTYNCSYCPPANKAGDDAWLKMDNIMEFVNIANKKIRESNPEKRIRCVFSGGEPTVWKGFGELIRTLSGEYGWGLSLSTNGSRSYKWWKENRKHFIHTVFSYHTESVNDEEFFEKVNMVSETTACAVSIMMNTNPEYFWRAIEFGERLAKENRTIYISYHPIQLNFGMQDINVQPYNEELAPVAKKYGSNPRRGFFKKGTYVLDVNKYYGEWSDYEEREVYGIDIVSTDEVNFEGWKCWAGLESIFIDEKGQVCVGTCRNPYPGAPHTNYYDDKKHRESSLGSILDPKNIVWPAHPVVCERKHCGCVTDIHNSKVKYYDKDSIIPIHTY